MSLLFITATACGGGGQRARSDRPPNVVLVVTDDLDATTSPFWDAMPKTRALIRDEGVTFTNAFATNPLCCPARATILTGKYPHNTEVFDSVTGLDDFAARASKTTIGVRLQQAGYSTAFIGKYLNGYEKDPSYVPPGWDEWFGLAGKRFTRGYNYSANHNGRMERFGDSAEDYQTDVLSRVATQHIDRTFAAKEHRPMLLTLFPSAPHDPIEPAARDADHSFADAPLPRSEDFDEADVSDKPRWLQLYPHVTSAEAEKLTEEYRNRLGSLDAVDDMVARVASRLEAAGELDRTVFVFTSDNGYSLGSHRVHGKLVPYDESDRVPLAIAGPGIAHGSSDELVTHPDLAATLYGLAGVDVPEDVDGRSLVPLLQDPSRRWSRNDFLVEYRGSYSPLVQIHTYEQVRNYLVGSPDLPRLIADYRALRSKKWLYVQWYAGPDHDYELYDLRADPYEMTNLLADPQERRRLEPTTDRLQERLEELAACSGPGCR
jgi:N-acetylglucosamine-6-sulfatase